MRKRYGSASHLRLRWRPPRPWTLTIVPSGDASVSSLISRVKIDPSSSEAAAEDSRRASGRFIFIVGSRTRCDAAAAEDSRRASVPPCCDGVFCGCTTPTPPSATARALTAPPCMCTTLLMRKVVRDARIIFFSSNTDMCWVPSRALWFWLVHAGWCTTAPQEVDRGPRDQG